LAKRLRTNILRKKVRLVKLLKSGRLKTIAAFFFAVLVIAGKVFAEDSNPDTVSAGDDELTQLLGELNVYNGFYHPEDEDLLKYNIRSSAEVKASVKALNNVPAKERDETVNALKNSMDLMNGIDSSGVYYFPGQ